MIDLAIANLYSADPVLAAIIDRVGPCPLAKIDPTFETLARSITFQQLHGKAALAIFNRLRKAVGRRFTAANFLRLSEADLRACGLSRQKIASLTNLAERVIRKEIQFRTIHQLDDEAVIATLSQVRGVGVWTAQMFLIFALQRPDVLPVSDYGLRNAVRQAYGLPELPKASELLKIAEKWRPYCTVASWYLWRSLDGQAVL